MAQFFTALILLVLLFVSGGNYWGALDWIVDKKLQKVERRLERIPGFNPDKQV